MERLQQRSPGVLQRPRLQPRPCAARTPLCVTCTRPSAAAAAAARAAAAASSSWGAQQQRVPGWHAAPRQQLQQPRARRSVAAAASRHGGLSALQVAGIVGAVLGLGTLNRVLYRLALVPLKDYVFFLAQAQNIGYIVIYWGLLYIRWRQGKVTGPMLQTPKGLFVLTGSAEAAAQLLMMTGAAHMPGALLPLLMQTVLLWNLLFARLVFGTRPTLLQVLGVLAVLAGVCIASWPAGGSGSAAAVEPLYLGICGLSFVFPALATIIKERIFKDAARRLGGRQLDVLVVNAYCSTAQAAFLLLLLPLTCQLKGLPLPQLPAYLASGTACLLGGSPACGADCSGAPLLPGLYVGVNVAFNIAAMYLVRSLGAVATALTMSCLVPITVLAFTLPLPYLLPAELAPNFTAGTLILMLGLLLFNARVWLPLVQAAAQRLQAKWQAA